MSANLIIQWQYWDCTWHCLQGKWISKQFLSSLSSHCIEVNHFYLTNQKLFLLFQPQFSAKSYIVPATEHSYLSNLLLVKLYTHTRGKVLVLWIMETFKCCSAHYLWPWEKKLWRTEHWPFLYDPLTCNNSWWWFLYELCYLLPWQQHQQGENYWHNHGIQQQAYANVIKRTQ